MSQVNTIELHFSCHCGFMKCKTTNTLPQQPTTDENHSSSLPTLTVLDCNCSMCKRKGFLHHIVSEKNFEMISPSSLSELSCYTFQTHVAKHYFCPKCGICTFYKPRSNPDGWSVNMHCLSNESLGKVSVNVEKFDGENWEDSAGAIKHLSE